MKNQQKSSTGGNTLSGIEGITLVKTKKNLPFKPATSAEAKTVIKKQQKRSSSAKEKIITKDIKVDILADAKKQIEKVVQDSIEGAASDVFEKENKNEEKPSSLTPFEDVFSLLQDVVNRSWDCYNLNTNVVQEILEDFADSTENYFESCIETTEAIFDGKDTSDSFGLQKDFIKGQIDASLDCASSVVDKMDCCCKNINSFGEDISKDIKNLLDELQKDID
jgi:hypothetical protein